MSKTRFEGVLTHTTVWVDEDGFAHENVSDVTADVNRLLAKAEETKEQLEATQKDLADLRNRRYWEEVELVTDRATGMTAAIKTIYQLEAKTMRLEMTPAMLSMGGFG